MTGKRSLFHCLDELIDQTVKLGDNNMLKVVGVRTIMISSKDGKVRELKQLQYAPQLTHNLLNVGQFL